MRSFLLFVLFACVNASSVEEGHVPLQISLEWSNTKTSLRTSCTQEETAAIDTLLSLHLGDHMNGVRGYVKNGDILAQDKLLQCEQQICQANYEIASSKVSHFNSDRLRHIQDHLASHCTSMIVGLANDIVFSASCRRSIKDASCTGSITTTPF